MREPTVIPVMNVTGGEYDRVTRLCVSCHQGASLVEGHGGRIIQHPFGIPAGGLVNNTLPLFDVRGTPEDTDDVIGCLTCHVPHQTHDPKIRRWAAEDETAACAGCHDLARSRDPLTAFRRR